MQPLAGALADLWHWITEVNPLVWSVLGVAVSAAAAIIALVWGIESRRYRTAPPALRQRVHRTRDYVELLVEPKTDRPCGLRTVYARLPSGDEIDLSEQLHIVGPVLTAHETRYLIDTNELEKAIRIATSQVGRVRVTVGTIDSCGQRRESRVRVRVQALRPGSIQATHERSVYLPARGQG